MSPERQAFSRACAAVLALLVSCASATPLPALPPPADLGALVPPAPGPLAVPPHVTRYPDTRVSARTCPGLPAGILVSPAVYAEGIARDQDRRRLAAELAALEQARKADRAAAEQLEQACRQHAAELAARARRSGTWGGVVALVGGALLGFLAGFVAAQPRPSR